MMRLLSAAVLLALCLLITDAFQIARSSVVCSSRQRSSSRGSRLNSVIRPDAVDFEFDQGSGGVRLANESVLKVTGTVKHKPGSANPSIADFVRYNSLESVNEKTVNDMLSKIGSKIVCTGRGTELYKDPGETVQSEITLAPLDAVRDALMGAGSAMDADTLVINFAGGEDAQVLEVLEAVKMMVLDLDVPTKAKINFNSISHSTISAGKSMLTVVALPEDVTTDGMNGAAKAIAAGEVYFCDGEYYTLVEKEINTAVA